MTELPLLEGRRLRPFAINDRGQVVAIAEVLGERQVHEVRLYDGERWLEVSPPWPGPGQEGNPIHQAQPTALTQRGDVSGYVDIISLEEGYHVRRAFAWLDDRLVEIDAGQSDRSRVEDVNERRQVLLGDRVWQDGEVTVAPAPPGGGEATFTELNNRGVAIGTITRSRPGEEPGDEPVETVEAAIWRVGGGMRSLGSLPGFRTTEALGINDAGVVVGRALHAVDGSRTWRAWVWRNGRMTDLGTLGGRNTYPGIDDLEFGSRQPNARGEVVGSSETGSGEHAFLWTRGQMVDLGAPPGGNSWAIGVNDRGQVLGAIAESLGWPGAWRFRMVVWQNGRTVDLASEVDDSLQTGVYDINNRGQVLGSIWDPATPERDRVVVWTVPPSWGARSG